MARDPEDLTATLRGLATAIDADGGAWLLTDDGQGALEVLGSGTSQREVSVAEAFARLGRALRHRRDPASCARALVAVPDVRGGLLVLERRRPEAFTVDDLAIARLYARQMADRVLEEQGGRVVAWSSQLEAVQSVASQLTRLTSVEEVSAALCTETRRVITYDNARVYVLGPDQVTLEPVAFHPHASEYAGETAEGLRLRLGEGITGWVASTGQPLIVPDTANDARAVDIPGTSDFPESMLLVPLRSEERIIGVVALSRIGLDHFREDDLRLLGVLADQAAVAIENARLLAEQERLVAELATLLDISRAGAQAVDERALAGLLASKLRAAAGVDACLLWRLEEGTVHLHCMGADGMACDGERRETLDHRLTREVLLRGVEHEVDLDGPDVRGAERERLVALGASTLLLLPLTSGGRVTGLVELVSRRPRRQQEPHERDLLRTMANQTAAVLENVRLMGQLRQAAEIDLVSGVSSHRHLQDRLRQETARAARTRSPLSLLMVDLDDFKRVNDRHGHQAGDRVLRSVANCLRGAVRVNDIVARYGGDEFVVLMPDTDVDGARYAAERVAEAVARTPHRIGDGLEVQLTCSIGLAVHPDDGRSSAALLRAADAAMYARKRSREGAAEPVPRGRPQRQAAAAHC